LQKHENNIKQEILQKAWKPGRGTQCFIIVYWS